MIYQYRIHLSSEQNTLIPQFMAYPLYAWVLEQIPEEDAESIHEQSKRVFSHYVYRNTWVINLLDESAIELFSPVLENVETIKLRNQQLSVIDKSQSGVLRAEDFLSFGKENLEKTTEIDFKSYTAFKQAGRYAIFPKEELLIQSVLSKWNECFPDFLFDDPDMVEALNKGLHIIDYSLRSSRYTIKNVKIPCFLGKIFLEAQLPIVLHEVWNALMYFSTYSGIGIKTTLGMGGIDIQGCPKNSTNFR